MHYYSKIRQKGNFKLPDFRDFFKLGRIYFCTGIYFFNLALFLTFFLAKEVGKPS